MTLTNNQCYLFAGARDIRVWLAVSRLPYQGRARASAGTGQQLVYLPRPRARHHLRRHHRHLRGLHVASSRGKITSLCTVELSAFDWAFTVNVPVSEIALPGTVYLPLT